MIRNESVDKSFTEHQENHFKNEHETFNGFQGCAYFEISSLSCFQPLKVKKQKKNFCA